MGSELQPDIELQVLVLSHARASKVAGPYEQRASCKFSTLNPKPYKL